MSTKKSHLPSGRLISLDALRGLDMFFLTGLAGIFQALPKLSDTAFNVWLAGQCVHPPWHGFTAYDLIFPMFIFIMGASIPFSFARRLSEEGGKRKLIKHVFIRTVTLTILGIFLWQKPGGPHPVYGYYSVLYRIGISYFFASLITMNTNIRGQVYWTFGLLAGYYLLMRFVPVPGYGIGDLSQEGNLQTFIGEQVSQYLSPNYRAMLSLTLIPSISNALMGVLAGQLLRSEKAAEYKAKGLLIGGAILFTLSFLIHLDFPINKNLWSPSFTFLTCGISALFLSLFYWLIDIKGYTKWAFFFVVVGMNSITIYVAGFIVKFASLADVVVGRFDFGDGRALALAITIATIKWLFLYYLYKQKVFLKI